jgi:hypothetical protein
MQQSSAHGVGVWPIGGQKYNSPKLLNVDYSLSGVLSALVFGVAVLLMVLVCLKGFLNEDAYILYIYSRNFADIGQIAFDATHGPAEGGTDFLWMALISMLYRAGIDAGVGAALLNGAGAVLLARALGQLIRPAGYIEAAITIVPLIVLTPFMGAAIGGFSVLFYVGIYATALMSLIRGHYRAAIWQTVLLCLTRPDGAVLGLGMMAILVMESWRDRRVCLHLALAATVGGAYFAWRVAYFGEWLPLPLMVKSQGQSGWEGLQTNLMAVLPLAAFPFVLAKFGRPGYSRIYWKLLLPAALLFVALAFAHQTQNVRYRFQAPIFVSILMALSLCRIPSNVWRVVAFAPFLLYGAKCVGGEVKRLTTPFYINVFPTELRKELGNQQLKVALTEAGRFPYYFQQAQYLDLVGLNSREVAVGGLTMQKIEAYAPDFIFVHHAQTYLTSDLRAPNYLVMPREQFLKDHFKAPAVLPRDPITRAPIMAAQFVASHPEYDKVFLVMNDGDFYQVYFVNSSKVSAPKFERALARSFEMAAHTSHCGQSQDLPCTFN